MKNLLIVICLVFSVNIAFAQKFGKIDKEAVMSTEHPTHPEAEAAYLVKNTKAYYALQNPPLRLVSEYFKRIKIYSKESNHLADQTIYLTVSGNDNETLRGLKAVVYNMENGKVVKTKLEKDDIFKEESENYNIVRFALPNVKEGSVIDIKYTINSPFLYAFPRHYFQSSYPVETSEYSVIIPEYFSMTPVTTGFFPFKKEEKTSYESGVNSKMFNFIAEGVPPLKDDEYVLNINDYRSSLKYELESIAYPGRTTTNYSSTWKTIGDNLLDTKSFGNQIKSRISKADEIVAHAITLEEKDCIKYIYDHVQSHYSFNNEGGVYCDQTVKKAYDEGVGSIQEINLTLVNLLKKANVDAYPIITRERSDGILNVYYPSLTILDRVFCYVESETGPMFLDASAKFYQAGNLPPSINNIAGLIIKKGESKTIDLPNNNYTSRTRLSNYEIDLEDQMIKGTGNIKLGGYAAVRHRKIGGNDKKQEEEEETDEEDEDDEDVQDDIIDITETSENGDIYSDIKFDFVESKYSGIKFIGDDIFLDGFANFEMGKNPFDEDERRFPVFYYSMPNYYYVSIITIPEGYSVKSLPAALNMVMPNKEAMFLYTASENGDKLYVKVKMKIDQSVFSPEQYLTLKNYYDVIIEKQKEKIILIKS